MPITILVADNDADVRRLLDTKLRKAGYETVLATDGQSAIDQAAETHPTLLILSPTLPQKSGAEVLKALGNSAQPTPRAIFLSASNSSDDIAAAFAVGADDFISKPFSPRVVMERVQVTLIRHGLWQNQEQA